MEGSPLVGVGHPRADLPEELEAQAEVGVRFVAPVEDGPRALDELHHHVRGAALRRARLEQGRHVGVSHGREGLGFDGEALALERLQAPRHLDRDLAAHRLVLLGKVDRAHAARPERPHDPVKADRLGERGRRPRARLTHPRVAQGLDEKRRGLDRGLRGEQLVDRRAKLGLGRRDLLDPALAEPRLEVEQLVDDRLDPSVGLGSHRLSLPGCSSVLVRGFAGSPPSPTPGAGTYGFSPREFSL